MEDSSEKVSLRNLTIEEPFLEETTKKTRLKSILIYVGITLGVLIVLFLILYFALFRKGDPAKPEPAYEFGLSLDELKKRTSPKYLGTKSLLKVGAPEYEMLEEGDKEALKHLVRAARIFEEIEYQIDSLHNLPFKRFIEEEIAKNNTQAVLTKILFDGQKGISALDSLSNEINLAKDHKILPGIGVYPEDLSAEEYQKILVKMLKEKRVEEVKNITNQRSIVVRDGEYLKAIDYVDYFRENFTVIADELEAAASYSTNENFTKYLLLQAKALRTADPDLDAEADIVWADMQYTPLELTITRENYADEITTSYQENKELIELFKEYNITPVKKDCLGFRVGIVNYKGTEFILEIKKYLPELAKHMPNSTEYYQDIGNETIKQTMVDADLVYLAGDVGAYRAGITLAENLPNDDKPSLKKGGGRRNVYHRQFRFVNESEVKEKLDEILDETQHQFYDPEADHWFTIGHENCHSLGPDTSHNHLGNYTSIIEENKADMCAIAFVDLLKNLTYYSEEQRLKIIVTATTDLFIKTKPTLSQAHRVRTVMQNYYLWQRGAYNITEQGKILVNVDNVVPAAYDMLTKIVAIQINDSYADAQRYVNDNFIWTDEMQLIADKLKNLSSFLNCKVENELADKIYPGE